MVERKFSPMIKTVLLFNKKMVCGGLKKKCFIEARTVKNKK